MLPAAWASKPLLAAMIAAAILVTTTETTEETAPSCGYNQRARYAPNVELLLASRNQPPLVGQAHRWPSAAISGSSRETTHLQHSQQLQINETTAAALDALRVHDEMMREAPRDGKTRVRMYFHQASSSDTSANNSDDDTKKRAKLNDSNGSANKAANKERLLQFSSSGWGLEFGFDPREPSGKHFARGYIIERGLNRKLEESLVKQPT